MKQLLLIAAVTVLAGTAPVRAAGTDREIHVPLSGTWRISLEDRAEFASPDCDDSHWDTVILPGSFMPFARKKGEISGTAWVRKSVHIDTALRERSLGLSLGRIGNADETFFNGSKIGGLGSFPPKEHSMWNYPRNYPVPFLSSVWPFFFS